MDSIFGILETLDKGFVLNWRREMHKCLACLENVEILHKGNVRSVYSENLTYNIMRCISCDLLQTVPQPTSETLNDIYTNNYRYDLHEIFKDEKAFRAKKIGKLISPSRGTTILELGSGNGALARNLASRYFVEVTAVDFITNDIFPGVTFIESDIESWLERDSNKYDYVVMSHTLEHMINIREMVPRICELLRDNGVLVLIVPNAKKRSRYWGYWQVPIHTVHFTESTLCQLFERCGVKKSLVKYAAIDTLGLLATFANIFQTDGKDFNSRYAIILRAISRIFRQTYWLGNSDLIVFLAKVG